MSIVSVRDSTVPWLFTSTVSPVDLATKISTLGRMAVGSFFSGVSSVSIAKITKVIAVKTITNGNMYFISQMVFDSLFSDMLKRVLNLDSGDRLLFFEDYWKSPPSAICRLMRF